MTTTTRPATDEALRALFAPRAITVLGASDDPGKIGGRPLAFLLREGNRGRLFPVNPSRATVQGLPAFPSLDGIPEPVDLVIVVVRAERVLESLEAAAAKGVGVAVVSSSGFAEVGAAGRKVQERIRILAERTGLRVVKRVLPLLLADPGVDMVVFQIALLPGAAWIERFADDVAEAARSTPKVIAVSCPQRPVVEGFRQAGVLSFDDPSVALRSLACLAHAIARRPRWLARTTEASPPRVAPQVGECGGPAGEPQARERRRGDTEVEIPADGSFLSEWQSRRLLEPFGPGRSISIPCWWVAGARACGCSTPSSGSSPRPVRSPTGVGGRPSWTRADRRRPPASC